MDQRQNNKLNMYTNVCGVLNENKQVYESYTTIVDTVTLFMNMVSEIQIRGGVQTVDYTGIIDEKTGVKAEMAREAADLALAGLSYAKENGNVILAAHFDYSFSDIRYATNNKAGEISQIILDDIKDNIDNLSDFLVFQEDADSLEALLTQFKKLSETIPNKNICIEICPRVRCDSRIWFCFCIISITCNYIELVFTFKMINQVCIGACRATSFVARQKSVDED